VNTKTIVYHWTTKENAKAIMKNGLRAWSFVCKNKDDWRGEVCLKIDLPQEVDWDNREDHIKWQAVTPEVIEPSRIRILK